MYRNSWPEQVLSDIDRTNGVADAAAAIEREGGPFSGWERLGMPASRCQRYLDSAIHIALLSTDHELFFKYLDWANSTATRALEDSRFSIESENSSKGWKNAPMYPGNQGRVRSVKAMSYALSKRLALDENELLKSAEEIFQSSQLSKGWDWNNPVAQENHLYGVRLNLIAGDWRGALQQLAIKKKFSHLERLHSLLLDLAIFISKQEGQSAQPTESLEPFEDFFQKMRLPKDTSFLQQFSLWDKHCFRLEVSLIRQRYFFPGIKFPDWNAALDELKR